MDIQAEHMKHRCFFMAAMCGLSLYSWFHYSLFDPIDNSFYTPYYQNCLLMLFYLTWDTYHMCKTPLIRRTDLMIHHSVSFVSYVSCINNNALQMSNVMIMECISLMNYALRSKENARILKLYRTLCILCVRMPLSLWMWLYYNPTIIYPIMKVTKGNYHYIYLTTVGNLYSFFIIYDMFILWKLYNHNNNTMKIIQ